MSNQGFALVPVQNDSEDMLARIPANGDAVGNVSLREALGWDEQKYYAVREKLIESGSIVVGRGRGGSVRRTAAIVPAIQPPLLENVTPINPGTVNTERDLYPKVTEAIKKWARDLGYSEQRFVADVSAQGSKRTGGRWTRPDLVLVSVENYPCVPGKFLEVITFEVKPSWSWNIESVYETASHSRFSTKSFLVLHQDTSMTPDPILLSRIESECRRFGVGLIICRDPLTFAEDDFKVEPDDRQYDPAELNEFLETQIPAAELNRLRTWVK